MVILSMLDDLALGQRNRVGRIAVGVLALFDAGDLAQ